MRTKSIEQLEGDFWKEPREFPTSLVKNSYEYRKKPLMDLTIEEIRILASQSIGLKYIVPLALEKLNEDILAEGDLYEGDLLICISKIPDEFWKNHTTLLINLKEQIEKNSNLIKAAMGDKEWIHLNERLT